LAKVLLHTHRWAISEVKDKYQQDSQALLVESLLEPRAEGPSRRQHRSLRSNSAASICSVCVQNSPASFCRLSCGHSFCTLCWVMHFQVQISQGVSTGNKTLHYLVLFIFIFYKNLGP